MPLASYRIPGLLLTPEKAWQGRRIDRLCSQIDLAPTLLSLAGIAHQSPFFGDDLLLRPTGPGRALLQHNRDIAIMDDHHLWMFGLQQHRQRFQRTGPYGTELSPPATANDPATEALERLGISTFQVANELYLNRQYTLPATR